MPSDLPLDHEGMYQLLADEILHFRRKPGERISENDLCRRFGLSRTPVRALLQRLQENGLVQIVPRKGSLVTRLDLSLINQLIYERVAVETMVLRDFILAANPTDVERVRYLYDQMKEAAAAYRTPGFDMDRFFQADFSMHHEWFRRMNLEALWIRLSNPHSSYTRFCALDIMEGENVPSVMEEHGEMLRMIQERETGGIEALLRRHLYGGISRLGSRIYTTYAPFFEPFGGDAHGEN